MYTLRFEDRANDGITKLKRSEPQAFKKVRKLLLEIQEHPRTGTGKPEQLKGFSEEVWSRRIDKKHRLVYKIVEDKVIIIVLSAYGHYDDR